MTLPDQFKTASLENEARRIDSSKGADPWRNKIRSLEQEQLATLAEFDELKAEIASLRERLEALEKVQAGTNAALEERTQQACDLLSKLDECRERLEAAERERQMYRDGFYECKNDLYDAIERAEQAERVAEELKSKLQGAQHAVDDAAAANTALAEKLATYEREAKAWEVIDDYCNHVKITAPGGHVTTWTITAERGRKVEDFDADTKLETLEAAAAWCESELTKGAP